MQKNNNDQAQYDKWWTDFISANVDDPGTALRADLVIKQIKTSRVTNVLDAGCGSAELIRKILNKTENVAVSGLDVSQKIIEMNKKRYGNANFFCLNLNDENPAIPRTFDMVVCCEVIEHLRNWQNAVTTLSKLVAKDGYIIVTTQSGKIYRHHKTLGHLKHFRKEEIEKELTNNGMCIMESHYSGFPFMNLKNILAHIFYKKIEKNLLKSEKQSGLNKVAFKIFGFLYAISSKKHGPQIFILARKPI
jgi:2-polyprenyl-3-methyl-5-hydroxy-6-metoxy-1,4-benzoquinol methylase